VRVGVTENEGEVVLFVENDGQLDPHVRQNVFRRFVTTRREQGGTGLGLSIVRAIAEAHGGHAELVESGPPRVRIQMRLPETARRGIGAS
jgi:signal transduction histidine kinase